MSSLRMVAVFLLCMSVSVVAGQKSASLEFLVVKDADGKPVRNAEIVLHPVDKHGKQKAEGLEIKTHEDGKAQIGGIPFGKLRVQVICPGYRTFGADYTVGGPQMEITIKLQKPSEQYSIYK
ncbi:MAG TPA: carboxypeptidase-like regulatory domain-containing protein [Candidatus Saccharimonadales bacterium]|nr:carboxypeptidase-like regulatory domain-containing protein [Candidatus Saccharimonadales bacterium]